MSESKTEVPSLKVTKKLREENARLRGALLEMLTAHGTANSFGKKIFKWECKCHACTNARKLLSGE